MVTRIRTIGLIVILFTIAIGGVEIWKHIADTRLPYQDHFAKGNADEWHSYGGTWELHDGAAINRSDERGAKLVAGSTRWTDYQLHADVKTLGAGGDVGILVRVNDADTGINSYRGYYAGVQSRGGALILGAANSDWIAVRPSAIAGGVRVGAWYHIDLLAVGCTIAAHLSNVETGSEAWSALHQANCSQRGAIGLRSLDTGAEWKNVSVTAARPTDLAAMLQHVSRVEEATYPSREQDFSKMMEAFYRGSDQMERAILYREGLALVPDPQTAAPLRSIKALQVLPPGETMRLRGVVTLHQPLFVLDDTGGVSIQMNRAASFNVGDELELTGRMHARGDHTFHADSIRVLWDRTPIHPVSLTSTQAASGSYEGSLVELRGDLISTSVSPEGYYVLNMQDAAQRFRVLVPQGLNSEIPGEWKAGSLLRVRGVCTAPPDNLLRDASFILRSRSDVDVEVLASPPWNRGVRLYILIALSCTSIAAVVAVYLKLDRWRNRAISQERERLALEMHDTLAQSFAGVSFHLQSRRKSIQGNLEVPEHLKKKLDIACSMTADTHREASDRLTALHPSMEDGDILAQLRRYAVTMLKGEHLPIRIATQGKRRRFSFAVRHELLAIAREAIANVLQHSKATEIRLMLRYEERRAMLSIDDNGEGFDLNQKSSGMGLQGMHSRAERIGGSILIGSTSRSGTLVRIIVPYGRRLSVLDWLLFLRTRFLCRTS